MSDRKTKDWTWKVTDDQGKCESVDHAQLSILMDIRDELKKLNSVFACSNFQGMPGTLRSIRQYLGQAVVKRKRK